MITDAQWLGLLIRSESDQPHEWLPIGWVVRNRAESSSYPDTYVEVIRQRVQFSHFNGSFGESDDAAYRITRNSYAGDSSGWPENNLDRAEACAAAVLAAPRWQCPFGHRVLHYYSPVSMIPAGRVPGWNWSILRPFTISGIDPQRFIFAESVKSGARGSGSPAKRGLLV